MLRFFLAVIPPLGGYQEWLRKNAPQRSRLKSAP